MTVYVDPLNDWGWKLRGRQTISCHLFTDSVDVGELHAMAKAIGMKLEWFQNDPRHPHYDLVPARRALAVEKGAIEVDFRQAVRIMRARQILTGAAVGA